MFRMFRFGPTWEEALCMFDMFDRNFVEAMPTCFACFALAQRGEEAMCMSDRNFVETMPASFVKTV
jgi:hypothetical protein